MARRRPGVPRHRRTSPRGPRRVDRQRGIGAVLPGEARGHRAGGQRVAVPEEKFGGGAVHLVVAEPK
ncbi:hypothetical protein C6A85_14595, partial [Mycobacterium sp. ITM-2017-0098]